MPVKSLIILVCLGAGLIYAKPVSRRFGLGADRGSADSFFFLAGPVGSEMQTLLPSADTEILSKKFFDVAARDSVTADFFANNRQPGTLLKKRNPAQARKSGSTPKGAATASRLPEPQLDGAAIPPAPAAQPVEALSLVGVLAITLGRRFVR